MTVKELKHYLRNIADDTPVYILSEDMKEVKYVSVTDMFGHSQYDLVAMDGTRLMKEVDVSGILLF